MEIKKPVCFHCHQRCGLLAHMENGKMVKVTGNPDHPVSHGYICVKGRAQVEELYSPDRLNYPLKRAGERGEGKWQRITWDQALDEITDKLKGIKEKYGAEAVCIGEGTDNTGVQNATWAFLNQFGTPNTFSHGTICWCNTYAIDLTTYGWYMSFHQSPYVDSPASVPKCVMVWGGNYAHAAPAFYSLILDFIKKGTKLIMVEPVRTELAKKADLVLQLRPATDTALGLGMLNVIINEELYDKEFVKNWCHGFEELKKRVQEYPPEKVAEITWVPKEQIIEAARMYATNRPGVITWGVATDMIGKNSTQAIRVRCILRAITGNLDVQGGERMGRTGIMNDILWSSDIEMADKMPAEQRKKQLGSDRFKLLTHPGWELRNEPYKKVYGHLTPLYPTCLASTVHAWNAMITGEPYPVKAVILQAHNAIVAGPNTRKVYQALKAVDLSVVMDYWMTPTAMLADYVLPAANCFERATCVYGGSGDPGNFVVAGEPAVAPLFERKPDYEFWRGLALRFGYEWPWGESVESLYDYRLKPAGLTHKDVVEKGAIIGPNEYKKYEKTGFATPTGKVELYSTIMDKLGYDPLPSFEEPGESPVATPEIAKEYPLILITGQRYLEAHHSQCRHIKYLRKRHPEPLVWINPETAAAADIKVGDWVFIEGVRGKIKMKAKITDNIDPRVISTEHGWWFPEQAGEDPILFGAWESNNSNLTSDDIEHCDQPCGGWLNRGLLCKIHKVTDYTK